MTKDVRNFLFGTILVGGLVTGAAACSQKGDKKQTEFDKTQDGSRDNVAVFEASRSKIKFALALVENYYPYVYNDNAGRGTWTTGEGLTKLYDVNGNAVKVTPDTKVPNMAESDVYKGRYMTYELLPKIKSAIKVPVDADILVAECVLGYCVGPGWIVNSEFTKQVNAGTRGPELAKYLTGFRSPKGVPKRLYFFAALIAGQIEWSDLLDLRAEGCYNLTWGDIFVCDKKGNPKKDKNNYCEWDFSKIKQNLEKAKKPKSTVLYTKGGEYKTVACELAKNIVPAYIWQEVSKSGSKSVINKRDKTIDFADAKKLSTCNECNDASYIAYKKGDYKTALDAGISALDLARTDLQYGASYYNIGISYAALEKYDLAIENLGKSLNHNDTKAARNALADAQKKQSEISRNSLFNRQR